MDGEYLNSLLDIMLLNPKHQCISRSFSLDWDGELEDALATSRKPLRKWK